MNKSVKIVLSIVGLAAVVVPAMLLIFLGGKTQPEPEVASNSRQIDQQTIKDATEKSSEKQSVFPSPSPATPSAKPFGTGESSPSAF